MKMITSLEMKKLEDLIVEKYKMPSILMMENAARTILEEILKVEKEFSRVIILCGVGNNGGDGFALGRQLYNKNIDIEMIIVGDPKKITGDALINLEVLKNMNIRIDNINDIGGVKKLQNIVTENDLLIDAILGIGIEGNVRDIPSRVVNVVNELDNMVISIDIPTGVNADTSEVSGVAIEADITVSLMLPKVGNVLYPGAKYNGELIIGDIGISSEIVSSLNLKNNIIEEYQIRGYLPDRIQNSHKGTYGRAAIIAGSLGMMGAAILTCRAALRSGVGLIELFVAETMDTIISSNVPEVITKPLKETRKGVIGINNIPDILNEVKKSSVVTIGPGCGNTNELFEILKRIIIESDRPMVIDADALNALAKNIEVLKERTAQVILTPHLGEMSRLINMPIEEINKNKISIVRKFAKEYNVVLVLKSARTVIGFPNGKIYINITGNSGMSTAGSGDVLTGIISSLVAQGISLEKAALLGVYIHGYTGDRIANKYGEYGLISGDIIKGISKSFKQLS